jgi:hypothetical protein
MARFSKHIATPAAFLIAILIAVLLSKLLMQKEGFLSSGEYPCAVDNPLLVGAYNVKVNPTYNNEASAQDINVNYPNFSSKHYGTNNIRYWRRPTNGLCSPPGFCKSIYADTEPDIPKLPDGPTWDKTPRVNYYVAHI